MGYPDPDGRYLFLDHWTGIPAADESCFRPGGGQEGPPLNRPCRPAVPDGPQKVGTRYHSSLIQCGRRPYTVRLIEGLALLRAWGDE